MVPSPGRISSGPLLQKAYMRVLYGNHPFRCKEAINMGLAYRYGWVETLGPE